MDPKSSSLELLLAPSQTSSGAALRLPSAREFPPLDEHIVQPELSRDEVLRGRSIIAAPSRPPHGDRHFGLDYVLGAHVKPGWVGSSDLLTRVAVGSDFASDTCVRKTGIDPTTGERYLEELAFEGVNEQSLRDVTEQAEDMSARGVRRVFALFAKKGEVREWSPSLRAWQTLEPEATLDDPALSRPIRVRELLDAAEADDAVARALLAKDNPVLVEARAQSLRDGLREGIEAVCELLGIERTASRSAQLDAPGLTALLAKLRSERRWP